MDIINEVLYGNISPFEQCARGDKRLKEIPKKFEDCMNEMHSIAEDDAFSYGFRLGVQLMAVAFLLPSGEDEQ